VSELAGTLYVNPRRNPDFGWAFASRFLLVTAYAFLVTYQAYYLREELGSATHDVAHQIFLGTLVQSVALVVTSPIAGKLSDRAGRRKVFVVVAALVYGVALLLIARADGLDGYLVGMAVGGVGVGTYMAVDLALVVDVLPDSGSAAKRRASVTLSSGISTSADSSARVAGRPNFNSSRARAFCSRARVSPAWTGRRMVRPVLAMPRVIAWRIHHVA
jgi:MFS family permease